MFCQSPGRGMRVFVKHLSGPKEIWVCSNKILQARLGPVLSENSRPLFSPLVLAKWKKTNETKQLYAFLRSPN